MVDERWRQEAGEGRDRDDGESRTTGGLPYSISLPLLPFLPFLPSLPAPVTEVS